MAKNGRNNYLGERRNIFKQADIYHHRSKTVDNIKVPKSKSRLPIR